MHEHTEQNGNDNREDSCESLHTFSIHYHPIAVRFSQVYKNRADDDIIMRKRIQTIISNEISHYVNLINTCIII